MSKIREVQAISTHCIKNDSEANGLVDDQYLPPQAMSSPAPDSTTVGIMNQRFL